MALVDTRVWLAMSVCMYGCLTTAN